MNAYLYHMLMQCRETVRHAKVCPLCTADEVAVFRKSFMSRPPAPDCSCCPLMSIRGMTKEILEDCATVGRVKLHLYEDFFEIGESAW